MVDGRKNNGGHKHGGRKPKAEEQKLIEKLTPMEPEAHRALLTALKNEQSWAVRIYFEYMYGKPMQQIDANITHENPIFKGINLNVREDNSTIEDS